MRYADNTEIQCWNRGTCVKEVFYPDGISAGLAEAKAGDPPFGVIAGFDRSASQLVIQTFDGSMVYAGYPESDWEKARSMAYDFIEEMER